MDLRQLTYFLRVSELGSVTAAAAALHVTQPTLTKSIGLLERELGTALFTRLPRGLELTEAGRRLVRHAEAVRNQVRDAHRELAALSATSTGMVTIGAGPAWLRRLMPEAVARATALHPGMQVRIVGGFDESLMRSLLSGDLDFVVAELPWTRAHDGTVVETLTRDVLCVCARAGHPLDARTSIGLSDLLSYPWVLPVRATRARQRLDALFVAQNAVPPEPTVETDSMAFMLAFVAASDALTYTTRTTTEMPEGSGLATLAVPQLDNERVAGVIFRRGAWRSPAVDALLAELRTICRNVRFN
ncbi:LysR family transcriptional regulator [Pararhizobium mangrovi]|uniref:HTH-type transcriptional regulator TtuA n=1 Tax=Pararhizobium mangrovi TaxID=2590452 RepID=A0A506TXQ9_9HYPH|nr:LysR family transcriptional regulator [Pararhizobium mangrovi]TPW25968.1 LysR family transcriptional regulator [Pararhizobium mangrovi]